MTNTIPNVPRELLADLLGNDHDKRITAERNLLAMLANAPSTDGVDGLEEVEVLASFDGLYLIPLKTMEPGTQLIAITQHQRIIDGLRGEVAKINSDRLACWAEFKVMTRACLDAEKERDQQAETISNYKSQFSELHTARNLLSRLSAAGFELGDDAAVSVIAERDQQAQRIGELEWLLRACHSALCPFDNKVLEEKIDAALSAGKEGE